MGFPGLLPAIHVSIPIGFSGSLQQCSLWNDRLSVDLVSIPIGFSGSLQLYPRKCFGYVFICFNPYRVFWFAATRILFSLKYISNTVSIPIGFSGSLQPQMTPRTRFLSRPRFQSLSGFLVRCNSIPVNASGTSLSVSIPIGFSGSLQRTCPKNTKHCF